MTVWSLVTSTMKQAVVPLIGVAILVYLGLNLMNGQRGLLRLIHVKGEVSAAEAVLDREQDRRERLEHAVSMLRPDSLDVDLLDERARSVLNFSHPDDFVIFLPTSPDDVQNMVVVPTERPDGPSETNPR
jgi:cell division protein FtsB